MAYVSALMAKEYLVTIKCPHCKGDNRVVIKTPRNYDQQTIGTFKCFDAAIQHGCGKDFVVEQKINIWSDATKQQKIEQRASAPADRMGGG